MAWTDKLNNFLYNSRDKVLSAFRVLIQIASLVTLGIVFLVYGFVLDNDTIDILFQSLDFIFGLFVISFFLRLLFTFQRFLFIMENKTETIVISIILIHGLSNFLFSTSPFASVLRSIGFENYLDLYRIAITIFMLFILGLDFIKVGTKNIFRSVNPPTFFIISFLTLIIFGTVLLLLPKMTTVEGSMDMLDALFTATSASCVTGLVVVDTGSYFTFQGQIVILVLMQLGGIGMVSFATFFAYYIGQGVGIRQQSMIQDFLSSESVFSVQGLIRQIIFLTLLIEILGAIFIFGTWDPDIVFDDFGDKLFYSVFHAVSAFCNAGFSLFPESHYTLPLRHAYFQHLIIALMIILGGLGFTTLQDLFSPAKLRERMAKPWVDWKLSTKVVLYTSAALIIFGTVVFLLLERNNTLRDLHYSEMLITSFFQSVTARTAGFNTVDIGELLLPSKILLIFLMFIGASPGSTGGGIKTSTFLLIIVSVIATIRGRESVELGRRSIPSQLFYKALTVFAFASTYNLIAIFILSIVESEMPIFDLVFEQISAFATVGLSTGITSLLSDSGKMVMVFSMFLGRVGTLTLAITLAGKKSQAAIKYPAAHLMVG